MNDGELRRSVAENAADQIVMHYSHLAKGKRLRLWKASFDAIHAGLLAYEHLASTRRVRAGAEASEN